MHSNTERSDVVIYKEASSHRLPHQVEWIAPDLGGADFIAQERADHHIHHFLSR